MYKVKMTPAGKVHYVEMYKRGEDSSRALAKAAGVTLASFQQWVKNYEVYGAKAFTKGYQHYSRDLKESAVRDYLTGKGSQADICKKYGILTKSRLRKWIMKYNSHEELKPSGRGGSTIVTKGRKTTFEERVTIVENCIASNRDYTATANKFNVSYQQVYTWVRKYDKKGLDSLKDGRGRRKPESEMSELERLRYEARMLKAQLTKQKMEIDFLKKLEELERK
jgi:transposase